MKLLDGEQKKRKVKRREGIIEQKTILKKMGSKRS